MAKWWKISRLFSRKFKVGLNFSLKVEKRYGGLNFFSWHVQINTRLDIKQLLDEAEHDNINYDSSHERASKQFQELFVHELYSSGGFFRNHLIASMPLGWKWPLLQNEAWCSTIRMNMSLICMWMKPYNHMRGWAQGLALKKRPKVIRKWPIMRHLPLWL